jgi:glycosyltransferase involved in cell wall biosynthesis
MKVLFISGREPTYTRNAVILKGLRENGVEVVDCTSSAMSYLFRYPNILTKFLIESKKDVDLIFIGFFGQPLVPVIKKLKDKPIVFDAFLSAYDTMCFDRKKFEPNSFGGRLFYWLDKRSCELADKVLLDTNTHIDYFINTFGLDREKFQRVFVGADDSVFYPRETNKYNDRKFRVFYYGTYRPLHGIEYIIESAKKLDSYRDIEVTIVGKGPERKKIDNLVQELKVENIRFINWIPYKNLPDEIANADICLGGHFSNIDKAKRTIAGKTFQFIAMKKPIIVGDNPANRELFENKKNALLVEHANADALAEAILELKSNDSLRGIIAEEGCKTFWRRCTPETIGKGIKEIIS